MVFVIVTAISMGSKMQDILTSVYTLWKVSLINLPPCIAKGFSVVGLSLLNRLLEGLKSNGLLAAAVATIISSSLCQIVSSFRSFFCKTK